MRLFHVSCPNIGKTLTSTPTMEPSEPMGDQMLMILATSVEGQPSRGEMGDDSSYGSRREGLSSSNRPRSCTEDNMYDELIVAISLRELAEYIGRNSSAEAGDSLSPPPLRYLRCMHPESGRVTPDSIVDIGLCPLLGAASSSIALVSSFFQDKEPWSVQPISQYLAATLRFSSSSQCAATLTRPSDFDLRRFHTIDAELGDVSTRSCRQPFPKQAQNRKCYSSGAASARCDSDSILASTPRRGLVRRRRKLRTEDPAEHRSKTSPSVAQPTTEHCGPTYSYRSESGHPRSYICLILRKELFLSHYLMSFDADVCTAANVPRFLCPKPDLFSVVTLNAATLPPSASGEVSPPQQRRIPTLLSSGLTVGIRATANVFSALSPFLRVRGKDSDVLLESQSGHGTTSQNTNPSVVPETSRLTRQHTEGEPTAAGPLADFTHSQIPLHIGGVRTDPGRGGERLSVCPMCHTLALATDQLGRVLLLHTYSMRLLHIWKGYREAHVAWTRVPLVAVPDRHGHQKTDTLAVLLYARRRGILELWDAFSFSRIGALNVGPGGFLVSSTNVLSRGVANAVVFVSATGEASYVDANPL